MARSDTRSDDMLTKQFAGEAVAELWLMLSDLPDALGLEARLSRLAGWVLAAERSGAHYGLRLPGTEIAPARGDAHRDGLPGSARPVPRPNESRNRAAARTRPASRSSARDFALLAAGLAIVLAPHALRAPAWLIAAHARADRLARAGDRAPAA